MSKSTSPKCVQGTIKLMDVEGYKVVREETYYSLNSRANIIMRWKDLYPNREVLIVHICPQNGELKIWEAKIKKPRIAPEVPKKPIVRFPAVYDNTGRSLYP